MQFSVKARAPPSLECFTPLQGVRSAYPKPHLLGWKVPGKHEKEIINNIWQKVRSKVHAVRIKLPNSGQLASLACNYTKFVDYLQFISIYQFKNSNFRMKENISQASV